jgi:hypothetical protein
MYTELGQTKLQINNIYCELRSLRNSKHSHRCCTKVIIDNMMNLELLFHSANLTGNSTLRQIAISHADVTMRNHIRGDGEIAVNNSKSLLLNSISVLPGSTWHVVEYDETTGRVIRKRTVQGYSDDSTWARGQAWALYGFANSEAVEIHF